MAPERLVVAAASQAAVLARHGGLARKTRRPL